MESFDSGVFHVKSKNIVYNEFMEIHQQERSSAQWHAVLVFSLLVANGVFDDSDNKFRIFRIEVVSPTLIIFQNLWHAFIRYLFATRFPDIQSLAYRKTVSQFLYLFTHPLQCRIQSTCFLFFQAFGFYLPKPLRSQPESIFHVYELFPQVFHRHVKSRLP